MIFYILPEYGILVTDDTVHRFTLLQQQTDATKEIMKVFQEKILNTFKEGQLTTDGEKPDLVGWAYLL